jgi:hypothetical protein
MRSLVTGDRGFIRGTPHVPPADVSDHLVILVSAEEQVRGTSAHDVDDDGEGAHAVLSCNAGSRSFSDPQDREVFHDLRVAAGPTWELRQDHAWPDELEVADQLGHTIEQPTNYGSVR